MLITPCLVEPVERERGALGVLRLAAVLAARLAPLVPVAGHEALRPRQALLVPLAAAAPRPVLLHVAAEAVAARRVVTELGAAGAVPAAPLAAVLRAFNMTNEALFICQSCDCHHAVLVPRVVPAVPAADHVPEVVELFLRSRGGRAPQKENLQQQKGGNDYKFERERQCWDLKLPVRWRRQRHPRVVVAGPTTWLAAPSLCLQAVFGRRGREGGEVGASESRGPGYLYLRFYHNKCLGRRIRNGENLVGCFSAAFFKHEVKYTCLSLRKKSGAGFLKDQDQS